MLRQSLLANIENTWHITTENWRKCHCLKTTLERCIHACTTIKLFQGPFTPPNTSTTPYRSNYSVRARPETSSVCCYRQEKYFNVHYALSYQLSLKCGHVCIFACVCILYFKVNSLDFWGRVISWKKTVVNTAPAITMLRLSDASWTSWMLNVSLTKTDEYLDTDPRHTGAQPDSNVLTPPMWRNKNLFNPATLGNT